MRLVFFVVVPFLVWRGAFPTPPLPPPPPLSSEPACSVVLFCVCHCCCFSSALPARLAISSKRGTTNTCVMPSGTETTCGTVSENMNTRRAPSTPNFNPIRPSVRPSLSLLLPLSCPPCAKGLAGANAPAQQHVELRWVRADGHQGDPHAGSARGGPDRENSRHGQEAQEEALQEELAKSTTHVVVAVRGVLLEGRAERTAASLYGWLRR